MNLLQDITNIIPKTFFYILCSPNTKSIIPHINFFNIVDLELIKLDPKKCLEKKNKN